MDKMSLYTIMEFTSRFSNFMGNAIKEIQMCHSQNVCPEAMQVTPGGMTHVKGEPYARLQNPFIGTKKTVETLSKAYQIIFSIIMPLSIR